MTLASRAVLVAAAVTMFSSEALSQTANGACWVQGDRADLELRASPFDSAVVRLQAGEVKTCYSRPRTLGRPIMGRVVPYGRPWRLGADEATSILLPTRARLGNLLLEPGWYSLYAVPGEREWGIVVNADVRRWGTPIDAAVRARDIDSIAVPVHAAAQVAEMFRMRLDRTSSNAADLIIEWDRTVIRLPIVLTPERS